VLASTREVGRIPQGKGDAGIPASDALFRKAESVLYEMFGAIPEEADREPYIAALARLTQRDIRAEMLIAGTKKAKLT